ncbi:MAG: serine/threonine-protein kinase [Deltaproteobacteria bacterium]|nr:serine/threonine-protein kinase [Deltaproteobacteria bacterium]
MVPSTDGNPDLGTPGSQPVRGEDEGLADAAVRRPVPAGRRPPPPLEQAEAVTRDESSGGRPPIRGRGQLGRFSLKGTLGQGGMGIVLEAYDDTLARTVALKLLYGRMVESRRKRLLREAQALAQLSHPNVVQVYEVGVIEEQMFIAMELVEGQNLRRWQEQRRPWRQVIDVYEQAGRGLAAAHAEGLIHRDFKPENCIMGNNGRVCVLDFGLARGLRDTDDSSDGTTKPESLDKSSLTRKITQSGKVLGTLSFLPLQQLVGLPADEKSDQYSFCVSVYEALYGVLPFCDAAALTLLHAQEDRNFQPVPSGSGVPRRVRKILLRGLARDPNERWPSVEALLHALLKVRHPRRWRVVAGAAVLGLSFGAGAFAVEMQEEPCSDPDAELDGAWSPADKKAVRTAFESSAHPEAQQLFERVENELDDYTHQWVVMYEVSCRANLRRSVDARDEDERIQCLDRHLGRLKATIDTLAGIETPAQALERMVLPFKLPGLESCNDPVASRDATPLDAGLRKEVTALRREIDHANTLADVGALSPATAVATSAVDSARRLEHLPTLAEALETLGRLQAMGPGAKGAVVTLQQGIQVAAEARHDSSAARAWTSLIYALMAANQFERANDLTFAATAAVERSNDELARAWLLNNMGALHGQQGNDQRAAELLEQALAVKQELLGPDHIDVGVSWFNLGHALNRSGRADEARRAFENARSIMVATVGASHPHVASVETGLGHLRRGEQQLDEAAKHHQRALEIREGAFGPHDIQVAKSLAHLGHIRNEQGRWPDAAKLLRRAMMFYENEMGSSSAQAGYAALELAEVEWAQGHRSEARTLATRATSVLAVDGSNREHAQAQFMLAQTLYDQPGERARAHRLATSARDVLDGEYGARIDIWLADHPAPPPPPEAAGAPQVGTVALDGTTAAAP